MTPRAHCVLAPNPGPMTLDGTNTWVLLEPGATEAVVVDPGPLDEAHLAAVLAVVADAGARVALTVLTHGHADHAEAVPRFAELTGAPVRAGGRGHADHAPRDLVRAAARDNGRLWGIAVNTQAIVTGKNDPRRILRRAIEASEAADGPLW